MGQLKVHPSKACREYEKYVYARVPKDIGQGSTSAAAPTAAVSFGVLTVQLQGRDHQPRGSDS